MKLLTNNICLSELWKETPAAKYSSSEFMTAMLTVILINVGDEKFSVDQSVCDAHEEMIETDCSENENACQMLLINQECLFDGETLVIIDDIFAI